MRRINPVLLWVLVALGGMQNVSSETLKGVIALDGLSANSKALPLLGREITSFAKLNDRNQFVIAFYLDAADGSLHGPLHIAKFDRKRRLWSNAVVSNEQATLQDIRYGYGPDEEIPHHANLNCLGSALQIKTSPQAIFINTHINPSAGCLLVLSPDLKFRAAQYGWFLTTLGKNSVIYHRSEVHFVSDHAAQLAVYNWETNREFTLYPRKPYQAIRLRHIEEWRRFYDAHDRWCREMNRPCDESWFNETIDQAVEVNDAADAVAFSVTYGGASGLIDAEPDANPQEVELVYVYRGVSSEATIEYRELLRSDVRTRFGDVPLSQLLEPNVLKQIFSQTVNSSMQ